MAAKLKAPKAPARKIPLLTPLGKENLVREIEGEKGYLGGVHSETVEGAEDMGQGLAHGQAHDLDTAAISARISRKEQQLQLQDPANRKLTGAKRQAAYAEMKELEKYLRSNMLTTWEMGAFPNKDPQQDALYHKAVEKSAKQEVGNPVFIQKAERWRELALMLEPEDPEFCNLERLRSEQKN